MSPRAFLAIPGDITTLTGGYGYGRRVLALAPDIGHLPLPGAFPFPSEADSKAALEALSAAPAGAVLLIDGLAYGALPPQGLAALRRPLIALVHHPLGLETGLDAAASGALIANERAALVHARAVIVTSPVTAQTLIADFAVPASKITIALPGTDPAPRATGSGGGKIRLLAIGSLTPRKGFDTLVEALASLRQLDWSLTIVGSPARDPACAAALRAQIGALGLAGRVELAGEMGPDRLGDHYDRSDLFVSSSHYEGYGMVLSEAMARGLPIVTTTGGAAGQTVPDRAALKVPPGDARALAAALGRAISDGACRAALAEASWRAGQNLPRWEACAAEIMSVINQMARVSA